MPKKVVEKKVTVKTVKKPAGLSVPVYSLEGAKSGSLELHKDLFGAKINKKLLAQALRVYFNNLQGHFGHTKTRGEVAGSTRKIRVQKGTGGARHGAIRAPIFRGGGIALGPKSRKIILDLPQKMKIAALKSALSTRLQEDEVLGLVGLEKISGKTKQMQTLFQKLNKKDVLLILGEKNDQALRAVQNLPTAEMVLAKELNTFQALSHKSLIMSKEAVKVLEERLLK